MKVGQHKASTGLEFHLFFFNRQISNQDIDTLLQEVLKQQSRSNNHHNENPIPDIFSFISQNRANSVKLSANFTI